MPCLPAASDPTPECGVQSQRQSAAPLLFPLDLLRGSQARRPRRPRAVCRARCTRHWQTPALRRDSPVPTGPPVLRPSTSPRPRRRVPLLQMRGLQLQGRTSSCLETCSEKGTQKSERPATRTPRAIDKSADAELTLSSRPPRPQPAPAPHDKGGDAR